VWVDVYTCGVNASDILICQGVYDVQPKLPFTPGFEVCGEVKEVASDVVDVRPGDRVIGLKKEKYSGFAVECVILEQDLWVVTQAMKFEIGASLIDTYETALLGLERRAKLPFLMRFSSIELNL
jgi:NADPH:quinone reductase